MFPLFETIRVINGIPQHLSVHQERMNRSIKQYYNKVSTIKLEDLLLIPVEFTRGLVKARLTYSDHAAEVAYTFYERKPTGSLQLIEVDDLKYDLKYSDRSALDTLMKNRGSCDDILIVKNGMVTDTSYTNILFQGPNGWVTPNTPLLAGTQRAILLKKKSIMAQPIRIEDLDAFHGFQLVNAMMPFDPTGMASMDKIFRSVSF